MGNYISTPVLPAHLAHSYTNSPTILNNLLVPHLGQRLRRQRNHERSLCQLASPNIACAIFNLAGKNSSLHKRGKPSVTLAGCKHLALRTVRVNFHFPGHTGANLEVGFIQHEDDGEGGRVPHWITRLPADPQNGGINGVVGVRL